MTAAQWAGILPGWSGGEAAALLADAALDWLKRNTKLEFDGAEPESVKALPAGARVFITRFAELMEDAGHVVSESMAGMSQTFQTGGRAAMLFQLARELIGPELLTAGTVAFGPRVRRWA